jgi:hypothetical protein
MFRLLAALLLLTTPFDANAQRERKCVKINEAFLDDLERRTFRWFWNITDPHTGLTPDRWPHRTFSSVAAIGFGLTANAIGAERRYISRDSAAIRSLNTLRFIYCLPQGPDASGVAGYHGFFYHFLNEKTGLRYDGNVELSTIDTALLLAGALFCQSYFCRSNAVEDAIRAYADSLYLRANWRWFQTHPPLLSMSWKPEHGYNNTLWTGYSEAMILYILALGSPTYSLEPSAWKEWTRSYVFLPYQGKSFVSFGPLFGHQYSHCWIDFRGICDEYMREKGIDYFENSRRATYSQRAYGKENPGKWRDYSETIWGFTACDGPGHAKLVVDGIERVFQAYGARGVSCDWLNDDGTIAPSAPGGSIAFAPEICIPALRAMVEKYGDRLYREYGFADAFNPTFITPTTPDGWFDPDQLGIDQGPIVIMIENLRSGLVWNVMKKNSYIRKGLMKAGFTGGWLASGGCGK